MKTRLSFSPFRAAVPVLALVGLVGLGLLASSPAPARSPADQVQRGFEQIDDYLVMKNGEDIGAKIYASPETRAILVVPDDIATPAVLLWPRTRDVESLKSMKVQRLPGGFVEVKKDAVAELEAPFEVVGTNVVFAVDEAEMRLKPKPSVLGLKDGSGMLEASPVYARRSEEYTPNDDTLERLAGLDGEIRVRVFFGSWCPACGQMVPRMLAVGEKLADSNLVFEYYGLPKKGFAEDPQARAWNIKSVPTGLVFLDDLEIGRIEGDDWRSPEYAIWKLLDS